MVCKPSQDFGTVCRKFRDCFWTIRGLIFGLSNCPCVPFLCVLAKRNNVIGGVLPQGECLVAFWTMGNYPILIIHINRTLELVFWVGNKGNLAVSPSGKL